MTLMFMKIKKDINIYYIFYDEDVRCGRCTVEIKNFTAELRYIKVEEQFRGQQLSLRMWKLVEDDLKKYGVNKIELFVYELDEKHNKLVKLYQQMGFRISGKESYKYDGDFLVHTVPMDKLLNDSFGNNV